MRTDLSALRLAPCRTWKTTRCTLVEKRHGVVNDSASHNKSLKPFRVLECAIDPRMEPSITKISKPQTGESSALSIH